MFETAIAQLRFAASLVFGLPFDLKSLDHLVDALIATRRECGSIGPEGGELVRGPVLDERDRGEFQLRRFRQQAVRAASAGYFVVNNLVLIVGVVGIANLWAQSGMRARDAAILGGALTVYDLIATSYLPLMGDLFGHVAELPFAPIVGWTDGTNHGTIGIGLGDLLVATAFPLVMRKAYGRAPGRPRERLPL